MSWQYGKSTWRHQVKKCQYYTYVYIYMYVCMDNVRLVYTGKANLPLCQYISYQS